MLDAQKTGINHRLRAFAKNGLGGLANLLPLSLLQKISGQRVFLPFYHLVSDEELPYIKSLYAHRGSRLFEADLDYLLKYFRPIDAAELISLQKGNKQTINQPVMHLSFDDGLRSCAEIIEPILTRKGIPASFFINSAFLDNKALMFRYKLSLCVQAYYGLKSNKQAPLLMSVLQSSGMENDGEIARKILSLQYKDVDTIDRLGTALGLDFDQFLEREKPYMTGEQVEGLLEKGYSIGGHSVDHPLYRQISLEEQLKQTIDSQQFLEKRFSLKQRIFAFPFTDDGLTKTFFKQLNTKMPFDLSFGGAGLKQDVIANNLQRFPMESGQLTTARKSVNTEFLYYILKSVFGKQRLKRAE